MEIKLPDISDALKPLPRLKSLVLTELENIGRKAPIDRKVFIRAFAGAFAFLLLLALTLPFLSGLGKETTKPVAAVEQHAPPPISDLQQKTIAANDGNWNEPLLPPAPVMELEEPLDTSTIPTIAADGRKPFNVYARAYDKTDARPRIAVVVAELGLSQPTSQAAINDLPGPITLAFSNYSREPDAWMARARSLGHETLLSIPMEPLDFPMSDPGPNTLLLHNNNDENKALLLKHLVNGKGYVGVTSVSGTRMGATPEKLKPILEEINKRGMMWLDTNLTPLSTGTLVAAEIGMRVATSDAHAQDGMSAAAILRVLEEAENVAAKTGSAVVLVDASPLAVSTLRDWARGLPNKHISLAPLSAVAEIKKSEPKPASQAKPADHGEPAPTEPNHAPHPAPAHPAHPAPEH